MTVHYLATVSLLVDRANLLPAYGWKVQGVGDLFPVGRMNSNAASRIHANRKKIPDPFLFYMRRLFARNGFMLSSAKSNSLIDPNPAMILGFLT